MTLARYSESLLASVRKLVYAPSSGDINSQPVRATTPTTPIQTTASESSDCMHQQYRARVRRSLTVDKSPYHSFTEAFSAVFPIRQCAPLVFGSAIERRNSGTRPETGLAPRLRRSRDAAVLRPSKSRSTRVLESTEVRPRHRQPRTEPAQI